jgi:hypothetical protein
MSFEGNVWGAIIAVVMLINTWISIRNGRKSDEIHKVINSQLTAERAARNDQEAKLVDATQRAAKAEGVLEGTGIVTLKKE